MQEAQPPQRTMLDDLESRQDELLRLLGDLEARTLQVLAELGASPPGGVGAPAASSTQSGVSQAGEPTTNVRGRKKAA